jgi:hypothetical protein
MVALDQTPALRRQALRQEAEIEILSLVRESPVAFLLRNRDVHRFASHRANRFSLNASA